MTPPAQISELVYQVASRSASLHGSYRFQVARYFPKKKKKMGKTVDLKQLFATIDLVYVSNKRFTEVSSLVSGEETPKRLLEAAGKVFAAKGYESATVREICREADVSNIAAVNYYFGDKEHLYIETVKTAFKGRSGPTPLPAWPPETPPAVRLREFIRVFATGLIGNDRPAWHMQIVGREMSQPTDACVAFVRDFARPHLETVLRILQDIVPPE